jgi:hypothetical protein
MLCLCGAKPTAPQPSRQVVYEETAKPAKLRHAKTAPEGSEASEDIDEDAEDFTESLLDISLRKDRELVLISGSLPDMKRDSAAIALDYKGVKFIEEMIEEGELPHYLRDVCDAAPFRNGFFCHETDNSNVCVPTSLTGVRGRYAAVSGLEIEWIVFFSMSSGSSRRIQVH